LDSIFGICLLKIKIFQRHLGLALSIIEVVWSTDNNIWKPSRKEYHFCWGWFLAGIWSGAYEVERHCHSISDPFVLPELPSPQPTRAASASDGSSPESNQESSKTVETSENWGRTDEIEREGVTFLPVDWTSDQNSYFQKRDCEIRMKIFLGYRKTIMNRNNLNLVSWEQRYDRTHRNDNGKWRRLDDSDKNRTNLSEPKMRNRIINITHHEGNDWLRENEDISIFIFFSFSMGVGSSEMSTKI
jgi:hypothetical protein